MSSTEIFAAPRCSLSAYCSAGRVAEPELELRRGRGCRGRRDSRGRARRRATPSVASKNLAASSTMSCRVLRRSSRACASRVMTGTGDAGLPRQPLDRLREAHAFGQHDEIENVAVLARGEVEPHRLLVIDEERRRLLLVEGREPLPLAPRLAQFHALAHDFRDRKPRAQLVEELRRESHGDFGKRSAERVEYRAARLPRERPVAAIVPVIHSCPAATRLTPRAASSPSRSPWRNPSARKSAP